MNLKDIENIYLSSVYDMYYGSSEQHSFIKTIKFIYSTEETGVLNPKIEYRIVRNNVEVAGWREVSPGFYIHDRISHKIEFNIYKIYNETGAYNWRFSIGNDTYVSNLPCFYKNFSDAINESDLSFNFEVYGDSINSLSVPRYFKEKINIKTPKIVSKETYDLIGIPALESIKVGFAPDGYSKPNESSLPIFYQKTSIQILDIPKTWAQTVINITITDVLGRVFEVGNYGEFLRAGALQKTSSTFSFINNISPYSNQNSITNIVPIAGIPVGSREVEFKYAFSIGSRTQTHTVKYDNDNYSNQVLFDKDTINNILINLLKEYTNERYINDNYTINLKLLVSSGFEIIEFTTSFRANFIESPTFVNNNKALSIQGVGPDDLSEPRMFNLGETITFIIPSFVDPNNDIRTCIIEVARADLTMDLDSDISNLNNASYSKLAEYAYAGNSYSYTLPFYAKNELLRFKAKVKDLKGNFSEYSDASTYIIACRTTNPTFSANNFRIEGETIDFNFQISDLGGSAPASGWDPNFYEGYRNFERTEQDQGKNLTLTIKLINSDNNTKESTITQGIGGYINFSGKKSISFDEEFKTEIMYLQLTLTIPYGNGNSVETTSSIYTLGNIPTVSYRPNRIGINTSQLNDNAVLTIKKHQNYNFVVLQLNNRDLTINLETGEIDGANISGGFW